MNPPQFRQTDAMWYSGPILYSLDLTNVSDTYYLEIKLKRKNRYPSRIRIDITRKYVEADQYGLVLKPSRNSTASTAQTYSFGPNKHENEAFNKQLHDQWVKRNSARFALDGPEWNDAVKEMTICVKPTNKL